MERLLIYILVLSVLLRLGFFFFGLYQDAFMNVKYTDIDYLVFSDAAKYVYEGYSPYKRETYRYTPLLSWLLVPNALGGYWYSFGKIIFMIGDLITGVVIVKLLRTERRLNANYTAIFASIWLLNPMVITISTRGSSESILTVIIMMAVYLLFRGSLTLSSILLGISIHFKLYPIIYLPSILIFLSDRGYPFVNLPLLNLVNKVNLKYALVSLASFVSLGLLMYRIYGDDFLYESYIYHFVRLDHRHNFSIYNIALYYKSAFPEIEGIFVNNLETIAFIPQIVLTVFILPLNFAKSDLISCLFLQTFTFVAFNKVITSQYFIWYLIFLPHFLANSNLANKKYYFKGFLALFLWVVSQACWLYFAYLLEFLGESTFDEGLFYSAIFFFLSNCWAIGVFIQFLDAPESLSKTS